MSIESFIKTICVQDAVYWEYTGPDGYGGSTYNDPVEVKCRWAEKQQLVTDNVGREFLSNAELLVTQDMKRLDYLYLGTLADIGSEKDPKKVDGAYEIKGFSKVPMIKSTTVFVRKVFL